VVEPQLIRQYVDTGKVTLIWRDSCPTQAKSRRAAQAARCAGQQGQFWEYHRHLYANQRGENQGQFSVANLRAFAAALKLDTAPFNACLDAGGDTGAIQEDLSAARARNVNATPYFFMNGRAIVGAGSFNQFATALDTELRRLGQ